jgi:hypothetical protein
VESLFYQMQPTDLAMLALPSLTILAATLLAALPAVIRTVSIDPAAHGVGWCSVIKIACINCQLLSYWDPGASSFGPRSDARGKS